MTRTLKDDFNYARTLLATLRESRRVVGNPVEGVSRGSVVVLALRPEQVDDLFKDIEMALAVWGNDYQEAPLHGITAPTFPQEGK